MDAIRALLTGAALGALAAPAAADVILVPQDHATIQAGVNAAQAGDTVLIAAGVYPEAVLLVDRSGLTLQAKGKVIVDAQDTAPGISLDGCTDIALTGLRVIKGSGNGVEITDCTGVTLTACRFDEIFEDGVHVTGSSGVSCVGCRATGVIGTAFSFSEAALDPPCDDVVVEKCVTKACNSGVVVRGSAPRIEKNRLLGTLTTALGLLQVSEGVVSKNKVIGQLGGRSLLIDETVGPTEITSNRLIGAGTGVQMGDSEQVNLRRNRIRIEGLGCVFSLSSQCVGERNRIKAGNAWVVQGCEEVSLVRNILKGADSGPGIALTGSDGCTLDGNRIRRFATAINVAGNDNTVLGGLVARSTIGLSMEAGVLDTHVTGLVVKACSFAGMFVDGTGAAVTDCRIVKSGGDGLRVFGTLGTLTGNKVTKSGASGVRLEAGSTGYVLSANVAKGNHDFDLLDESGGMNDVQDDNQFGTTSP